MQMAAGQESDVKELSHVVITNMTYVEGDPMLDIRLEWYVSKVLPKFTDQTDKNFDIAVKVNPATYDKIRTYLNEHGYPNVIVCKENNLDVDYIPNTTKYCNPKGQTIKKYSLWKDIEGLGKYDIQTCHDSDDFVSKEYIAKIKQTVYIHGLDKPLHIHFQPLVLNTKTNEVHRMQHRYGVNGAGGSAFFSVYNPDKEKEYIFCREVSHYGMPKKFNKSVVLPEGDCWIVVNGYNHRTKGMPPLL